jgi:hypothetical protein
MICQKKSHGEDLDSTAVVVGAAPVAGGGGTEGWGGK